MYTGELTTPAAYELALTEQSISVDPASLKQKWMMKVTAIFEEAMLKIPENTWMQSGGKEGIHTEHLGYILAEMQYLQRAYPNSEW